ncbi:MAG: two-component sensor histidine kinase [Candidatus Anammoximicrobium sp.]|nr:two-component sensor histidine kinase [Candidatus Anammoximicrobium sp.]
MLVQSLLAALILAAFAVDAGTPLGPAVWLLHFVPLAFSHLTPRRGSPYALATASSLLVALAWWLAPAGYDGAVEGLNRGVFAGVLWLAAARVVRRTAAEKEVRELNESLERRVHERTAQLETANQELEAFTYSVSHDLRAPLRAIDGFARILQEDYGPQLGEEGRRVSEVVCAEARRMGQLIDDLLDFSRLGRRDVHLADTDVQALVCEVFEELRGAAAGREVDFSLGDLPRAQADAALLWHVWFNLLDNALKFTRHRGRAEIKVRGFLQEADCVYCVEDNGAGFDMRYADKLFRVFERLHAPHEFEGTGVGLALVQRIVRRHGGRVWAAAEVDRGARFCFTLPR